MSTTARKHLSAGRKSTPHSQATYLTRRIITFLRDNEYGCHIRLQRLSGNKRLAKRYGLNPASRYTGCVDWDLWRIVIDFRSDPLSTIIHEILHVLYPKATEKDILRKESLVMRRLTEYQAVQIWTLAGRIMRTNDKR